MQLTETPPWIFARFAVAEAWRHRRMVLGIAWLVSILGWLGVLLLPNTYTSHARIYADTQGVLGPLMKGLAVQPNLDQQLDVMRRTLLGRPNIEQVIRMTDLDLSVGNDREQDALVERLQRSIHVQTEGKQLFSISYANQDPVMAQRVVQSLLEIFVEQNVGISRRDIENTRRFIDGQIADYEQRLRETENKVAEFRRANAAVFDNRTNMSNRIQRAEAELQQLRNELQSAIWRRDQLRAEMSRTPAFLTVEQAARGTSGSGALADARARLQALLARTTEQHPDVIALRRQIAAMEAGGAGRTTGSSARVPNPAHEQLVSDERTLKIEIDSIEFRIGQAEKTIDEQKRLLENVPEVELKLAQMNRDYEIIRDNYNGLISRRESALIAQRVEDETPNVDFRVIEPPMVPVTPSGPPRLILFAVVLVLGLGAGPGIVLLRLILRQTFESTKAVRRAFNLPVLGSISEMDAGGGLQASAIAATGVAALSLLACFGALAYVSVLAPASMDLGGASGWLADLLSRSAW